MAASRTVQLAGSREGVAACASVIALRGVGHARAAGCTDLQLDSGVHHFSLDLRDLSPAWRQPPHYAAAPGGAR